MNTIKKKGLLGLLVLSSIGLIAQEKKVVSVENQPKEGQVRIKMVKDVNGDVSKTDETFSFDDKKSLEDVMKKLKEKGIEIDLKDKEGSIRYIQLEDNSTQGGELFKIIKLDSVNYEENTGHKIHELIGKELNGLKVNIVNLEGEIDQLMQKNTIEMTEDFMFDSSSMKNVIIRTNVIAKEELSEEDKHQMNVFVTKIELDHEGEWEDEGSTMVFFRKSKVDVIQVDELPVEIDQSFDKTSSIKELKLFPNPTDGEFNMQFSSKVANDYMLSIKDVKGSVIYEKQLLGFEGNFSESFDLSQYDSGLYLFNLTSDNDQIMKKIIVK